MKKIIFAHIPKTAGTSFRIGLEKNQAQYCLYKDYGVQAVDTSELIKEYYDTNNYEKLNSTFLEKSSFIISGHFHDSKLNLTDYTNLIKGASLVTFFRDPLERIISEYWHFKTNYNDNTFDTFLEMISQEEFNNRQIHSINNMPLESFSYIGITENYEKCLNTFNEMFKIGVPFERLNERQSLHDKFLGISKSDIELFCLKNIKDISLYNRALTYSTLLNREKSKVKPYKYKQFAGFSKERDENVEGWAVDYHSFNPVDIVFQNEYSNKSYFTKASIKCDNLIQLNLHASGYAGFKTELKVLREHLGKGKVNILINGKHKIGSIIV